VDRSIASLPLLFAAFTALQSQLRHPPRKLRIHAADSVVLNRKVSAYERHGVD
jgi:hypothetical protein